MYKACNYTAFPSYPTMSASSETTPLLPTQNGNGHPESAPFPQKVVKFFKAEGEPSWLASYRFFFFGSWLNVLLVFIPLSFVAEHLEWDAAYRFSFSFIAIMPLAAVSEDLRAVKGHTHEQSTAPGHRHRTNVAQAGPDPVRAVERLLRKRRRNNRRCGRSHAEYGAFRAQFATATD